ncbi:Alpha/Beta hydrolase protein [Trichoderma chlorosporum]
MLTVKEIRALSDVNPEFEPILNSGSPILTAWDLNTDIFQVRAIIQAMKEAAPKVDPATLPYLQEDIQIPVRDNRTIDIRVYKPREESAEGRPGLVVFHGGGYAVGDFDTEAWLCALFAKLGGVAVNVMYRHAPEHLFPSAVEDAYDATKWTAQNLKSLGIDPEKGFLVGGDSSGGEMAVIVAHLCLNDKLNPPLTGIYAAMPGGVNNETVPEKYKDRFISLEQNADAPVFSAASLAFIWKNHQVDPRSPLAFPLAFPTHKGLPKTYFQVCGLDPVRDCALVMEQVFKDEGVATRRDIYPGLPHGFWGFFPDMKVSAKQRQDAEEGLKWLLSK